MTQLDLAVRTLFAEFQEAVFKRAALEQSLEKETFTKKRVKGKDYWYRQRYVDGKAAQRYFGPATEENNHKVHKTRKERQDRESLLRRLITDERRRGAMLRRGGLPCLDASTSTVLERLANMFLIDRGGILIGSHAFAAYSGMLGCLFEKKSLKTLDIDIVRDEKTLEIAAEPFRLQDFLSRGSIQFQAVPRLSHKYPPSSFVGSDGLRIDLVAPLRGRPRGSIPVPGLLDAGAQPLRFLDYLIEDPIRGVLIGNRGGIPVTVPQPTRFVIHKLITSVERPVSEAAKRAKDLQQASQLILACSEEQPEELSAAYREAVRRGKGWNQRLQKALRSLSPESQEILGKI